MTPRDFFSHIGKEQVLLPEALPEHERLQTALWDHLVRLENNVALLEDLISVPGTKLLGSGRRVLPWIGQNLYEYTIIVVWRLWDDNDPGSITLKRLRRVISEGIHAEFRDAFHRRLREIKPPREVRDILLRATQVRHGRLAHIDEGFRFDESRRGPGIEVADLRTATVFLSDYYNKLQFGVHSSFGLATFERREGKSSDTLRMLEELELSRFGGRVSS
jgi:hypothetical protein